MPHKATRQCLIFETTSRQGWHFKNFTGTQGATGAATEGQGLQELCTAPTGLLGKKQPGAGGGVGWVLRVGGGRKLVLCTNITKN